MGWYHRVIYTEAQGYTFNILSPRIYTLTRRQSGERIPPPRNTEIDTVSLNSQIPLRYLLRSWFEAGSKPVADQLRTSYRDGIWLLPANTMFVRASEVQFNIDRCTSTAADARSTWSH